MPTSPTLFVSHPTLPTTSFPLVHLADGYQHDPSERALKTMARVMHPSLLGTLGCFTMVLLPHYRTTLFAYARATLAQAACMTSSHGEPKQRKKDRYPCRNTQAYLAKKNITTCTNRNSSAAVVKQQQPLPSGIPYTHDHMWAPQHAHNEVTRQNDNDEVHRHNTT